MASPVPQQGSESPPTSSNAHPMFLEHSETPSFRMTSLVISTDKVAAALDEIAAALTTAGLDINTTRIQTAPSKNGAETEIHVDLASYTSGDAVRQLSDALTAKQLSVHVMGNEEIAWFPRQPEDLDHFVNHILEGSAELQSDHPGFHDVEYRQRRTAIARIAREYKQGTPIPHVEYSADEVKVWGQILSKLAPLHKAHACREYLRVLPLLRYTPDRIPQLDEINHFLKRCTGFRVRPVAGLLSSRDFLNGLAFRVFHCCQYVRHHSEPFFSPEPDLCHELLGHVPLFADPSFAAFSQAIGLASLAATEEDIKKLATLYWFTVEFGLCRQDGELKVYGAALLSSFGEIEYSMSKKPQLRPFDPVIAAPMEYPICTYQPTYFVAETFEDATEKMRAWASRMEKPFTVHYDPFTCRVDILDDHEKIAAVLTTVTSELVTLQRALTKSVGLH